MLSLAIVGLSLVSYITAQSTSTGAAAIQAHFKQSGLVPSLLQTFEPKALVSLNFQGVGDVSPGQPLTNEQTAPKPTVSVTALDSSVSLAGNFTIFMVDADIVGTDESGGVNRHWLENFVTITSGKVSNTSAVPVTAYAGPGPAPGSGAHRYVVLLYAQPATFVQPAEFTTPSGVEKFSLTNYVKDSGLGDLLGATYITVEEGTATVSVSATSPVVSSTLAAQSSSSGTTSRTAQSAAPSGTGNPNNAGIKVEGFTFISTLVTVVMYTLLA